MCEKQSKSCPNQCSQQGSCVYYDDATGNVLDDCKQGDISCYNACSCFGDYSGSDCSVTTEELLVRQNMRTELLSYLGDLTQNENPTSDSIEAWTNSLSSITQNPDEVSSDAIDGVTSIARTILDNANGASGVKVKSSGLAGVDLDPRCTIGIV